MKFITEDDLRDLYRKQPFADYDLKEGERLTPGARQFLVDRGVDMYDRKRCPAAAGDERTARIRANVFDTLRIGFLAAAREVMADDAVMYRELIHLERQLSAMEKGGGGDVPCRPCSGFSDENFHMDAGDCFETDDVLMQLEKGRGILILAGLRSSVRRAVLDLEDIIPADGCSEAPVSGMNRIINTLSQMICAAAGGGECQRRD